MILPLFMRMRFVSKPRHLKTGSAGWLSPHAEGKPKKEAGTIHLGHSFLSPFTCGLCQNRAT
jgi:hypothetical protein